MTYETVLETVLAYDEYIRETSPVISLLGIEYDAASILSGVDPIAYKCGWIDWCDAEGIDTDALEDDYTFTRDAW